MYYTAALIGVAVAAVVLGPAPVAAASRPPCHTQEPSEASLARATQRLGRLKVSRMKLAGDVPALKVPLKFIIIHAGATGRVTRERIDKQVVVLNQGFAGSSADAAVDVKIQYELESVLYVDNGNWYRNCGDYNQEMQFKNRYVEDPTRWLYVFSCSGGGYLGWSTLAEEQSEEDKSNAVVVADTTFPDGPDEYGLGDTLTHEVGHFFGLLHTFQGGCEGTGDGVDDTPAEATSASDCDLERDTCPDKPGKDPVQNFMDYTADACMDRFSAGQVDRMRGMISLYKSKAEARWKLPTGPTVKPTPAPTPAPGSPTAQPTAQPTKPPTAQPTKITSGGGGDDDDDCTNFTDWADSFGDDCAAYGNFEWCNQDGSYGQGWDVTVFGTFGDYAVAGVDATGACCACGGGYPADPGITQPPETARPTGPPTARPTEPTPTSKPTSFPTAPATTTARSSSTKKPDTTTASLDSTATNFECVDSPLGWRDSVGDGCAEYELYQWCKPDGSYGTGWGNFETFQDYATVDGNTANTVCCACGGGQTSVPITSSPITSSPITSSSIADTTTHSDSTQPPSVGPAVPTVSSKSCSELGWSFRYGNKYVCGESDKGMGGCHREVEFDQANGICAEAGARLCTVDEIHADATRGTGCGHDWREVWTADTCDGGRYAVVGKGSSSAPVCYSENSRSPSVRCCADKVAAGPAGATTSAEVTTTATTMLTDRKTCADLGWPFRYGNAVCGESDKGLNGGCNKFERFDSADAICSAAGGRLCTLAEVEAQATRGTGCGFDGRMIWTSDTCEGGEGRMVGRGRDGAFARCATLAEEMSVRCCSDPKLGGFRHAARPAAMITSSSAGSSDVYGADEEEERVKTSLDAEENYGEAEEHYIYALQRKSSTGGTDGSGGDGTSAGVAVGVAVVGVLAIVGAVAVAMAIRTRANIDTASAHRDLEVAQPTSGPGVTMAESNMFTIDATDHSLRLKSVRRENPGFRSSAIELQQQTTVAAV